MKKINLDKGITLMALVITIIVMLILSSIVAYTGFDVINSSKLTVFKSELEIMQAEVSNLYERNKNGELINNTEIIKLGQGLINELGETNLANSTIINQANLVFTSQKSGITDKTGYRYYDSELLKTLGIESVNQTFFINVEKRIVVSYDGFNDEEKIYYTLMQMPNSPYNVGFVEDNTIKPEFEADVENIGLNKFRINIYNIQYSGNIKKWEIKYKEYSDSSWITTEDSSFVVNKEGMYIIKIYNGNIESEEMTVECI